MNNLNISSFNLNKLPFLSGINFMIKIGFLIADLFLMIFLLVVLKQVSSMNHIVHDSNDYPIIKTFAFLLLLISLSLFIVCLVIL